jgi:hypothetical protein
MKLCTFIFLEHILNSNYVLYLLKKFHLTEIVFIKDMKNEHSFFFHLKNTKKLPYLAMTSCQFKIDIVSPPWCILLLP